MRTIALAALTTLVATTSIARAEITCPQSVAVEQKAAPPGADWSVTYANYPIELAGVTIFDGSPTEMASLVPDDEKKIPGGLVQTWRFEKNARGFYLQCNYARTTAVVFRRLPDSVKECRVSYYTGQRQGDGSLVVKSVRCTP